MLQLYVFLQYDLEILKVFCSLMFPHERLFNKKTNTIIIINFRKDQDRHNHNITEYKKNALPNLNTLKSPEHGLGINIGNSKLSLKV